MQLLLSFVLNNIKKYYSESKSTYIFEFTSINSYAYLQILNNRTGGGEYGGKTSATERRLLHNIDMRNAAEKTKKFEETTNKIL